MTTKMKVLEFANQVSGKKMGSKSGVTINDPEYRILEPVITDEMAEVALCFKMSKKMTAAEVAPLCGKTIKQTEKLLWELAVHGVMFVNKIDGVDTYWYETWVPGIMEMMANNKENLAKFPQIGEAFDAYGKTKGPMSVGNFPVGLGLMRVIPIETSISGETRRASYEEISKYLNENNVFTVSDCACRVSREAMGEGCGHISKDMCIQMGHAAEYYIRTGRGREITREEALEIIGKAERDGMIHQIPNVDGSGKTHAICNCCGCGCFSLRTAEMFLNPDMVRSNYVSKVDRSKCVACGECVDNCQVNALRLGHKLCDSTNPPVRKPRKLPYDNEWGPENWNLDYRYNRKEVVDEGTSPCKTECPAHIGIQGYIKLASQERYREALELIKIENPFPAVCGRICPRSCESACTRGDVDDPIAIDDIKKFVAEQDLHEDSRFIPEIKKSYNQKIAVIGAGPSGLSCAYYLAVEGYKVTVFEKQEALGGMLTLGIPSYRLEKDVVNAEIDILRKLGVKFKTGIEVGKDVTLEDLRKQGYKGFYLAIGAQAGRKLNVEGEDGKGVLPGVDFIRDVNLGKNIKLKGNVVVIGGGNVAIDVARTATRVGGTKVEMFCLESREQMPALEEEIEEAIEEGIIINNSWGPKRIIKKNGKAVAIEFRKCISVLDETGKFNPVFDENDIKIVETSNIIISIGQAIAWGDLIKDTKIELNPNMTIKADPFTYQTAEPDIFTGGDVLTGPKFAIDAIAAGKQAAISIHRSVHPGQSLTIGRSKREFRALDKSNLELEGYDRLPRERASHGCASSKNSFRDLRGTFTLEQVKKETERCLSCGATEADEYLCVGCGVCVTKCKFDAISLVRKYDAQGVEFKDLKPLIVKQVIKRKFKIAFKKIKSKFISLQ